ncbi:hypothetical protein KCU77_g18263, partial [Aureobasidium melanogenum]
MMPRVVKTDSSFWKKLRQILIPLFSDCMYKRHVKIATERSCNDTKRRSKRKTYSSRDSHVVTHRSTNLPFNCLCMAERTGCPVFS